MSSQRGNVKSKGPPKHKNGMAFRPLKYDSSSRSQKIAATSVVQVCEPCEKIMEWKIKYKKYKVISQCKTCTKCLQKNIKYSYHIVCLDCSRRLQACCKCGKTKEIVKEAPPAESIQMSERAALEAEVKRLPLRRRKTYYRYMDRINGIGPKAPAEDLETDEAIMRHEDQLQKEAEVALSHSDYIKKGKAKLEELSKNCKLRHDYLDDMDDNFGDSDGENDEDDE